MDAAFDQRIEITFAQICAFVLRSRAQHFELGDARFIYAILIAASLLLSIVGLGGLRMCGLLEA